MVGIPLALETLWAFVAAGFALIVSGVGIPGAPGRTGESVRFTGLGASLPVAHGAEAARLPGSRWLGGADREIGAIHRRFQSAELIRLADSGSGAVKRQLARLTEAGLVDVTRVGDQKHYQARTSSPVSGELSTLILETEVSAQPRLTVMGAPDELD